MKGGTTTKPAAEWRFLRDMRHIATEQYGASWQPSKKAKAQFSGKPGRTAKMADAKRHHALCSANSVSACVAEGEGRA